MLSVIMIVKNEADNLRQSLQSVAFADEIIVLDSGSTDNTTKIAREFTDKVFVTDWPGYGIQKQRALSHATGSWVLNLDADEVVSYELQQDIIQVIQENKADAYRVPILLNFYGKTLYYSLSPKGHIRLFKRQGASYSENIVHEAVILPKNASIKQLKSGLVHHSYRDVSHALEKMNTYSSSSAVMRAVKPSFLKTIFGACWMFFRCYFLQGGFLEGRDGFLLAVMSAENSFYRGIKMIYQDKERLECLKS